MSLLSLLVDLLKRRLPLTSTTEDHVLRLLANPNPLYNQSTLLRLVERDLREEGSSLIWVVPNGLGLPCKLWHLPLEWVRKWDTTGLTLYFPGHVAGVLRIPHNEVMEVRQVQEELTGASVNEVHSQRGSSSVSHYRFEVY
jgi:hypothetical protein